MGAITSVLSLAALALALALAGADARAQDQPEAAAPPAKDQRAADKPKEPKEAKEAKQPRKKPPPRRSVQQIISTMPASPPIVTEGYRPTLHPRQPLSPVPGQGAATVVPPGPVQINSCDAGGCTDTNGMRYNGGVGNTVIGPGGRSCTTNGTTMQCF